MTLLSREEGRAALLAAQARSTRKPGKQAAALQAERTAPRRHNPAAEPIASLKTPENPKSEILTLPPAHFTHENGAATWVVGPHASLSLAAQHDPARMRIVIRLAGGIYEQQSDGKFRIVVTGAIENKNNTLSAIINALSA